MRGLDFEYQITRIFQKALLVLAAFVILLFWEGTNPVTMGFIMGATVSILNGYFLSMRIRKMAILARIDKAKAKSFMWMNYVSRWTLIVVVCLFALRTGWFNLLAMLGGFMLLPALSTAEVLRTLLRQSLREKCNA